MVYQNEYDMLIENIVKKGFKKAEYFLACAAAAKKKSLEKEYNNYTTSHKERYKSDKLATKKAVKEEIKSVKNNLKQI